MDDKRLLLHNKLINILGSSNVYYQPPENTRLRYDAIVYSVTRVYKDFADDNTYKKNKAYDITYIHKNPNNKVFDELCDIASFERSFISDGMYHDIFNTYLL